MCHICDVAKNDSEYTALLRKMLDKDKELMKNTIEISKDMPILNGLIYTSIKWPVKLFYPLFEVRNAFAVPNSYYQPLFLNGGKMGVYFSHNSTRSIFFSGDKLMVYSKTVNHKDGLNYFTSFVLAHFEKEEYSFSKNGINISISTNEDKLFKNLITGEKEYKKISFNFSQKSLKNRLLTKSQASTSTKMSEVYNRYGSLNQKLSSSDMEGYVITVPHFAPHPYMLQLHKKFGFISNREFQEKGVLEYFKAHAPSIF